MIKRFEIRLPEQFYNSYPIQRGVLSRETFFITEYVTRYLRTSSVKNAEVQGKKVGELITLINSKENNIEFYPKNIICQLSDNYEDTRVLRGITRTESFLRIIEHSTELYESLVQGLGNEIQKAVNNFRKDKYKNIWIYKKKLLKGIGTAKLECELEALKFNLFFVVDNTQKQEIYRKRILQAFPDSADYHSLFKDLKLTEGRISITNRIFEEPIFSITTDQITQNEAGTFYPFQTYEVDESTKELVSNIKLHPRKTKWWDHFIICFHEESTDACPIEQKIEI